MVVRVKCESEWIAVTVFLSAVCTADCRRLRRFSDSHGIFESVLNWFLVVLNVFFTIYKIRILSRVKCVILLSFLPKRSKSLKIVSNSALIVESSIFVKNDQKLTGFRVIKMILFQYFLEASLWFASHLNSSFLTPHLNTRPGVSWSRFKLKKTYQSFPILCFSFYL